MSKELISIFQQLLEERKNIIPLSDGQSFKGVEYDNVAFSQQHKAWAIKAGQLIASVFGKNSGLHKQYIRRAEEGLLEKSPYRATARNVDSILLGLIQSAIMQLELNIGEKVISNSGDITNLKMESDKVFIVHGHDETLKQQLEIFLSEIGIDAVVLHRKADEGMTVIEKFEKHSNVGYAFVLLSPDDLGCKLIDSNNAINMEDMEKRARQNVIFEFGYFLGKLGRKRVCCIYKEGVVLPTDASGIIYKKVSEKIEEVAFSILKDLRTCGFKINY